VAAAADLMMLHKFLLYTKVRGILFVFIHDYDIARRCINYRKKEILRQDSTTRKDAEAGRDTLSLTIRFVNSGRIQFRPLLMICLSSSSVAD
jgi:hypothetical protein